MRTCKITFLVFLIGLLGCSEPFSFDIEQSRTIVIDGNITTERGTSYIRIFKIFDYDREFSLSNLDVRVIGEDGEVFPFRFSYDDKFYCSTDFNFAAVPGSKYRMEAIDENGAIIQSSYDSVPIPISFNISLEEITTSVFTEETNTISEKRATTVSAEIPLLNREFYSRLKFRYQIDNYFSPGDSLGFNENTAYTLHKSTKEESNSDDIRVLIGQRLIDKYFVFVDPAPGCDQIASGFFTSDVIPLTCGSCCHLEEFWWITYEVSIESLSQETFEYWENVEKLSKNDGLIFDTYPFPIRGNISCDNCEDQVIGSFRTISESVRRINLK